MHRTFCQVKLSPTFHCRRKERLQQTFEEVGLETIKQSPKFHVRSRKFRQVRTAIEARRCALFRNLLKGHGFFGLDQSQAAPTRHRSC